MRLRRRAAGLLFPLASLFTSVPHGNLLAQALQEIPASIPADTHLPTPANASLRSLFLVGDAAVSSGAGGTSAAGQGWGEPLATLFDSAKINVVNRAITSSSSRSYITEGYWSDTLALVKPGDVVLIQFGQHEGVPVGTTQSIADLPVENSLPGLSDDFRELTHPGSSERELVHTYGWYLRQIVVDTIAHGGTPILCSPIPHRDWQAGHLRQSRETYAGWAKAIAVQQRVPFLDLNRIIAERDDALGEQATTRLFNDAGTNTSATGAQSNAEAIVAALKGLTPDPLNGFFSEKAAAIPAVAPPPPSPPTDQPHL